MGAGFLTGKIDASTKFEGNDFRNVVPRFAPEARSANQAFVHPWIVPIPGTRKLERLEENLGAAAIEPTAGDQREIDRSAAQLIVQGARAPENVLKLAGR